MNSINLTGRLVDDPVRRDTGNGVVAEFRLAVDGRPRRLWITVETWGHQAGAVAAHLTSRRHVAVTGRLQQDEYHDRHGSKQTRYRVVAHAVDFLDQPHPTATHGATTQEVTS